MDIKIEKGQPLVLPDGTVIDKAANGKTVIKTPEQEAERRVLDEILSDPFADPKGDTFKRTLADVNVDVKQFNPVMLILGYNLWGLDANAIGRLINLEVEKVKQVMDSDLFHRTRTEMLEAIRYAEAASIHGYLSNKSRVAAATIASMMTSKKDDVAMAAAKDVLDRSGFRPVDRTEHVHKFEDELRIVHILEDRPVELDI